MPDLNDPTSANETGDPTDAIADLLIGGDDTDNTETDSDETEADQGTAAAETDEDDESNPDADDPTEEDDDGDAGETDDEPELATLLGLDSGQVAVDEKTGAITVQANVDGKLSSVSLKDAVAGYQTQQAYTSKSMQLAEERRGFEGQAQQRVNEINAGLERNQALTQQLQGELLREFEQTNWDQLRIDDPAEYAARQQDMSVRYNRVQNIDQGLQQQKLELDQRAAQQHQMQFDQFVSGQRSRMLEANPAWKDPAVFEASRVEMRDFMASQYGFGPQDLDQVMDARQIAVLQDAMAYRKGVKAAAPKQKNVPKIQRAKRRGKNKVTKLAQLTKAAKNATGGNKRDLQVNAVAELLSIG